MNNIFDLKIPNTERVLLGLPLLVRVKVCCRQRDKERCVNCEGRIGIYIGRTGYAKGNKYDVRFSPLESYSVMEIEVLP